MKLKNRIAFDCGMLLVFATLQLMEITGVAVHEILSVIFFILVVSHCWINRKWIKNIRKSKKKTFANIILLAVFLITICSGIPQSDFFLSRSETENIERWHIIHAWATRVMIGIVLFHLLNNIEMIMGFWQRFRHGGRNRRANEL